MSLIHNERTKLVATLVNNCAVGSLVAGVIAPTYLLINTDPLKWGLVFASQAFWLSIAYLLHSMAIRILGRLKE